MKGHFTPNPLWTNEVWGLAVCNTEGNDDKYLTCSDDATLRLYSAKKRRLITYLRFDKEKGKGKMIKRVKIKGFKGKGMPERATARTVAISHHDDIVVAGMKDGTVWVIKSDLTENNYEASKNTLEWSKTFK